MLTNLLKSRSSLFGANPIKKLALFGVLLFFGVNGFGQTISIESIANGSEEGEVNGRFRVYTDLTFFTGDITVDYSVGGTAIEDADYSALVKSVVLTRPFLSSYLEGFIDIEVIDDFIIEGGEIVEIVLTEASSGDIGAENTTSITIQDNDVAGFTLSTNALTTVENGNPETFTVALTAEPYTDVVLNVVSGDAGEAEGIVSPTTLTFAPSDWNIPQTVTVTPVDDSVVDGPQTYNITVSVDAAASDDNFDALAEQSVSVTNNDEDVAGFVLSTNTLITTENGSIQTFTAVLTVAPTANVILNLISGDPSEGTVTPSTMSFDATNWNASQTVSVTPVDDNIADGPQTYSITVSVDAANSDVNFASLPNQSVNVTNNDDDTAGVTVSAISGNTTENGGTATFTMVLTSQPTANVTIPLSSSNINEGILGVVTTVTFTPINWSVPQTIVVTGVDDSSVDGNIPYTIITGKPSSSDPIYNALSAGDVADVTVINEDNDNCTPQPVRISGIPTTFCKDELTPGGVGQDLNEYVAVSTIPTGFNLIWSRSSNFNNMGAREDGLVFSAGTYYGFFSNGSCTSIPLAVNLAKNDAPSIVNVTPATICGPGTATLRATPSAAGGSVSWYASETATTNIGQGLSFTTPNIQATTIYYVEVLANGCTSERVPVTATVTEPLGMGTTTDTEVCNDSGGNNSILDLDNTRVNGAIGGTWSIVGTPPGAISIGADNEVDFEGADPGEYIFRFTADTTGSPCIVDNMESTVEVTITVAACGMDLGLEKTVDKSNASEGEEVVFTITLTNNSPITATNIQINELIHPNLGFQYVSHSVSAGSYDEVRGVWNLDEVLGFGEHTLIITATVLRVGTFQNVAALMGSSPVDADAANNTARVSVTVGRRPMDDCGFLFNQISPNGDGINDTLYINCIEQYPNNFIQIYDRYGNEVFVARKYDNSWMGTGKNGNLPKGTYFYILDLGDGTEVRKGWIQIIR